jgi:hypothetical protein
MKKILLILFTICFTTNIYAHSTKGVTPDFDYKQNCTKKNSVLNYISKHPLYSGDGVTIGGKHIDEYMPQIMSFFKENIL